ncbi:Lcl C-terminal domain-containing protein [[Eubacterium] cellulosolvens]
MRSDLSENGSSTYIVVDTGQTVFYDNSNEILSPDLGGSFYGSDAQYRGIQSAYQDNGDGTVTDVNTGLMWQQDPGEKMTYDEAVLGANAFRLAGYDDWRLPTIKELYSLILFSGSDPSGLESSGNAVPFIDTDFFEFEYGDTSKGERIIDSQFISNTEYVSTTMEGAETAFGVNFADGRIKGYPTGPMPGQTQDKKFFVLYVRGNTEYGSNNFVDNGDGTITDSATGLMWMQDDSGSFNVGDGGALSWEHALEWAENLIYAGYSDWRLPNAKELQSIIDYTRSPATTSSAAIDPIFYCTSIIDEGGETNYPFYWTGTTHANSLGGGRNAVYIAFGEALGYMEMPPNSGNYQLLDVHGAGAQRSDPKEGNPAEYPYGHGPQGDVIRIYNYVRCVRGGDVVIIPEFSSILIIMSLLITTLLVTVVLQKRVR